MTHSHSLRHRQTHPHRYIHTQQEHHSHSRCPVTSAQSSDKLNKNKLIVTTYIQNVNLWLKHKSASVLAIGHLHHQSATAPGCITQLWDVRGLPLPVRSSKPVSCNFLNKFSILLCFQFLSGNSWISRQAQQPFDSHKFLIKILSKIHQDFPELWSQMYCYLFTVHSVLLWYPSSLRKDNHSLCTYGHTIMSCDKLPQLAVVLFGLVFAEWCDTGLTHCS